MSKVISEAFEKGSRSGHSDYYIAYKYLEETTIALPATVPVSKEPVCSPGRLIERKIERRCSS